MARQANAIKSHVAIATPCGDLCHMSYTQSLFHMAMRTATSQDTGLAISFIPMGSSILPLQRQKIAIKALEGGCTHILWIDSDMEFPPDLLIRLLSHQKDIVAANCIARRPPWTVTARDELGEQIGTFPESTGLQEVHRVGLAILLHTTDVLRNAPSPWFDFEWIPEKQIFRGEDFAFCDKARSAGFQIFVDHDLSKQINHIGIFPFNVTQAPGLQETAT